MRAFFRLAGALTALAFGLAGSPQIVLAQGAGSCDLFCKVCSGGGHSYGTQGTQAWGGNEHGCGNMAYCGQPANWHDPCESQSEEQEDEELAAAEALTHYETLDGLQIYAIVSASGGRFYLNPKRGSVQGFSLCDRGAVTWNLPMSGRQLAEFLRAAQNDGDWEPPRGIPSRNR